MASGIIETLRSRILRFYMSECSQSGFDHHTMMVPSAVAITHPPPLVVLVLDPSEAIFSSYLSIKYWSSVEALVFSLKFSISRRCHGVLDSI